MTPTWRLDLEVDGVFDDSAAHRVEQVLACVQRDGVVRINFTRVRHFEAHAFTLLAQALASRVVAVPVVLHGLGLHQVRLLRYLGIDVAALEGVPREAA